MLYLISLFLSLPILIAQGIPAEEEIHNEYKEFRNMKVESGKIFTVKDPTLKKDIAEINLNGKILLFKSFLGKDIGGIFDSNGIISFSQVPPLESTKIQYVMDAYILLTTQKNCFIF